jgi:hypothetical protein
MLCDFGNFFAKIIVEMAILTEATQFVHESYGC